MTLWVTDYMKSKITKKMIKQAKKELECIVVYAHHEYMESKDFIFKDPDFGTDWLYSMSVCYHCGHVSVHDPDGYPD